MRQWFAKPAARTALAVLLYGGLLIACFATLSDWRIRSAAVVVVLMFFGLTLFHPRRPAPPPWGRPADCGAEAEDEEEFGRDASHR